MKWNKYTIKTTTAAVDFISSELSELRFVDLNESMDLTIEGIQPERIRSEGIRIEGIQIEDNVPLSAADKEKLYIDLLPDLPPDEGIAYVSFYLKDTYDGKGYSFQTIIDQVNPVLERLRPFVEIGDGTITELVTEDLDWINNWKKYFKSFTIDDILIKPTWEEQKDLASDQYVVEIDPGTSFGTGKHETTQLCIKQIRKYMKQGDHVLDIGCGSGILSILCLKLGAGQVVGTDIDPECMTSTLENMKVNGLSSDLGAFFCGNLIEDANLLEQVGTECYEMVVANLLADSVMLLTPVIPMRLKLGGIYITSGIIDFKEEAVKEAIQKAGLAIIEITHQGEWASITAKRIR
ncbi:50S ribosomal protein L11 methyltransferase [Lachnospiraceae bacterium ZAX-1]